MIWNVNGGCFHGVRWFGGFEWVWLLREERAGWLVEGRRFARCANADLNDDETVAKMGHPGVWAGQSSRCDCLVRGHDWFGAVFVLFWGWMGGEPGLLFFS